MHVAIPDQHGTIAGACRLYVVSRTIRAHVANSRACGCMQPNNVDKILRDFPAQETAVSHMVDLQKKKGCVSTS